MEMYRIHLVPLYDVYSVTSFKQRCTKVLASRLTTENVIDLLQLAKLCDTPDLYLKFLTLVINNFKVVEATGRSCMDMTLGLSSRFYNSKERQTSTLGASPPYEREFSCSCLLQVLHRYPIVYRSSDHLYFIVVIYAAQKPEDLAWTMPRMVIASRQVGF